MLGYHVVRTFCKPVQWICIPGTSLHLDRLPIDGPCILAPTHISHLEPFVLSLLLRGRVRWMARSEFYQSRLSATAMQLLGAFPVRRTGYARPAIREAVRLLDQGERVGIFPEAGVSRRQYSAMRGAPIKHGACLTALHAQAPIYPIAVVGTHAMNLVRTWLPLHNAPIHFAIGKPIEPGPCPKKLSDKRRRRFELGEVLCESYQSLYQELLTLPGVTDDHDLHKNQSRDPASVAIDPATAAGAAVRRQQNPTESR